ncbi:MAG TPA: DUF445 domain-containing protein [Gemmatimonadaceae bacterium]|nr:DUF445 domain-containing protein [Gemmatimonadaceae bacterium]
MTEQIAPVTMPLARPDDADRQAQLDRMKRRATGLLVVATAVFGVTRWYESRYPWLGFIRATAEAAMVGGLADWFAVTALFRHPLGLPIPHTAIVAARKDRIGRTLGNFVQYNFLARDVVERRLAAMRIAERAVTWLSEPANARLIARQVALGLARSAEALPDDDARRLIGDGLAARVHATRVAPVLGSVLSFITADSRHQDLLDDALGLIEQSVRENREIIRVKVAEESPWWMPEVVDERIYLKIVSAIENLLHEVRESPDHPLRAKFHEALVRFTDKLRTSPDVIAKAEALKEEIFSAPVLDEIATSIWRTARTGLVRYADRQPADGESAPPGALERGIVSFAEAMRSNDAMLGELDRFVTDAALTVVEQYRHEVGELIAHTVAAWDPDATSRRIELAIGRDLQFIRINGTLVGGLAGLIIYAVSRFW